MRILGLTYLLLVAPALIPKAFSEEPVQNFTCTFVKGSKGREAENMNVSIDLNTPKVTLADGKWTYRNQPAKQPFGEDTLSIRQDEHSGDILMAAIRADVPVLLQLKKDGTMYYAYTLHGGGMYGFTYKCRPK